MLVKFTIDSGTDPVTEQAREDIFNDRLSILRRFDPDAEDDARKRIQAYLTTHTEFTAARIASTGRADEWHPEFEKLYTALEGQFPNPREAHEEAGKFLGLLVWNEALLDEEKWHFTSYPKEDSEYMVTHYFAVDGHIRVKAMLAQASTARAHGDEERAIEREEKARLMKAKWGL
jgi:hypothetical protein